MSSAQGSAQLYHFSVVQDPRPVLTLSATGPAGTALVNQLMEKLTEQLPGVVISQQPPGTFPSERADDAVDRGYYIAGAGAEHTMRPVPPPPGQHPPPPYENEPLQIHGQSTNGPPDVEMTSSPPPEEYYAQAGAADPTAHRPGSVIADLETKVAQLMAENHDLKEKLDLALEAKTDLTSRLTKVSQERDNFGQQRQTNLLKIKKLNDMIIKNSQNSDEPMDDEVLREMFKVRNMATEVIKTFYPDEAKFDHDQARRLDPYYAQFYEYRMRSDRNPERRRRLLISLLFGELRHWIFGPSARRFGLPEAMETQLQIFEKQIEGSKKVEADEALEWRRNTVAYAGRLDLGYSDALNRCTDHISRILEPMILSRTDKYGKRDKKQVESLDNALFNLCSVAMKLALRFRSSRTLYEFKSYPDNTSLAACDEDLITKLDSDGPISRPLDPNKLQIFCTLFGALVKTRPPVSGEPGDTVVLEKGHIIVHEPTMRGPPR